MLGDAYSMNTLLGVLIIAAFIGVILLIRYFMRKGINAAAKSANKHILFRSEYQTERQLISEPLTFETTVSVEEIMRQLTAYVSPEDTIPAVRAAFHELSRSADHVTYAYGNKFQTQTFVATVQFKKSGEATQGIFKFLRWHEKDGMLVCADIMKKMRTQVWSAFSASDTSVKVIGTPASNS
jgi:hypothetical protein